MDVEVAMGIQLGIMRGEERVEREVELRLIRLSSWM
jgi:hypothetical protein